MLKEFTLIQSVGNGQYEGRRAVLNLAAVAEADELELPIVGVCTRLKTADGRAVLVKGSFEEALGAGCLFDAKNAEAMSRCRWEPIRRPEPPRPAPEPVPEPEPPEPTRPAPAPAQLDPPVPQPAAPAPEPAVIPAVAPVVTPEVSVERRSEGTGGPVGSVDGPDRASPGGEPPGRDTPAPLEEAAPGTGRPDPGPGGAA